MISYFCTGESVKDVLTLAGKEKEESLEATRVLLHETIIYANSLAKKGQRLTATSKSSLATTSSTTVSVSGKWCFFLHFLLLK